MYGTMRHLIYSSFKLQTTSTRILLHRNSIININSSIRMLLSTSSKREAEYYRGAVCTNLGAPLEIQSLPSKSLKNDEVKVSVHFTGINFADVLMLSGKYQQKPPLPFVAGLEIAGLIKEVGKDVTKFKPGQRVLGLSGIGGFAEECIVKPEQLFEMPDSMDYKTGSALAVSYGTAWMALHKKAAIRESDTVLVTAGAGAFGSATLDLAKHSFSATTIGACGGQEKSSLLRSRGVDHVIDYNVEDIVEVVNDITNKRGADVIIDAVGGDTFKKCLRSIGFEGRIVVIGFASGEIPRIPAQVLLLNSCSVIGLYWGDYIVKDLSAFRQSVNAVIDLYREGSISPLVSTVFSLDEVNEAFHHIHNRKSTGKVVLKIQ